MKINTRIFGEMNISEEKVITFVNGIIGFPELTQFALIHDGETPNASGIRWLQSLQETQFALPVIDPLLVKDEYNPQVEEEWLSVLGELNSEDMLVLATITVPEDLTQMSVNLKAPVIVNVETLKACQVITESEYPIKYPIYELLQMQKEAAQTEQGEC